MKSASLPTRHWEQWKCRGDENAFSMLLSFSRFLFRGNLVIAIDLFNKALELARTELEMTHLFSLRDAAASQLRVTTKLNIGPKLLNAAA